MVAAGTDSPATPTEESKQAISLVQSPEIATGRFATMVQISGHEEHYALSFIAVDPLQKDDKGQGVAYLAARVYMAPAHLRRFYDVLGNVLQRLDNGDGAE